MNDDQVNPDSFKTDRAKSHRSLNLFLVPFFLVGLLFLPTVSQLGAQDLGFSELYKMSVLGMSFTEKTKSLEGKIIEFSGFMAPPLRVMGTFFVLTKDPVSLCPFCNSDADWPLDIVVVYLKKSEVFHQKSKTLLVRGRLELGSYTDPDTGFVSQVRIVDATYTEK